MRCKRLLDVGDEERQPPTISPTAIKTKGGLKKSGAQRGAKRRRVMFKTVEVREMFVQVSESAVPGDGGPPLGISPRMKRTLTRSVNSFELERETGRRLKSSVGSPQPQRMGKERFAREGRLPAAVRREILQRCSRANKKLIRSAERSAQEIQRSRCDSNRGLEDAAPPSQHEEPRQQHFSPPLLPGGSGPCADEDDIARELRGETAAYGVAELFGF